MTGQRAVDIAREVFPGVSQEDLLGILVNHTGYPEFWDGDPETCVRRQLEQYKRGECDCPDCKEDAEENLYPCVSRQLGKHHHDYIDEHNSPTWCGSTTGEKGWCFVSIDHAAENRRNRGRLLVSARTAGKQSKKRSETRGDND